MLHVTTHQSAPFLPKPIHINGKPHFPPQPRQDQIYVIEKKDPILISRDRRSRYNDRKREEDMKEAGRTSRSTLLVLALGWLLWLWMVWSWIVRG
jgi:hypothetical protein